MNDLEIRGEILRKRWRFSAGISTGRRDNPARKWGAVVVGAGLLEVEQFLSNKYFPFIQLPIPLFYIFQSPRGILHFTIIYSTPVYTLSVIITTKVAAKMRRIT